jgi:hypothetical protein
VGVATKKAREKGGRMLTCKTLFVLLINVKVRYVRVGFDALPQPNTLITVPQLPERSTMARGISPISTLAAFLIAFPAFCQGFVVPSTSVKSYRDVKMRATPLDFVGLDAASIFPGNYLYANTVAGITSSSLMLSETEAWVQPLFLVLGPVLNLLSFGMVRLST